VDPEDLRKLSTMLSALATEKQKAAKVVSVKSTRHAK